VPIAARAGFSGRGRPARLRATVSVLAATFSTKIATCRALVVTSATLAATFWVLVVNPPLLVLGRPALVSCPWILRAASSTPVSVSPMLIAAFATLSVASTALYRFHERWYPSPRRAP